MATATHPAPSSHLADAIRRAPIGEPLTPEQRAEVDQIAAGIDAGTVELIEHDDVPAWLEAHAHERRKG